MKKADGEGCRREAPVGQGGAARSADYLEAELTGGVRSAKPAPPSQALP
jgi:hypothetical protein